MTAAPQIKHPPAAKTGMLIRRPVREVFEAFVDPDITTRFWFTKSTGRLEPGKRVQWEWEMYGISIPVKTKSLEVNERIVIEWPGENGPTRVEWVFEPMPDGSTFVEITNNGFAGTGDEIVKAAIDSAEGFTWVLAGLKALLEHDIELNVIADRFPKGITEQP